MGMNIYNRPSLSNIPISPSVPAPTLSTKTFSSLPGETCSHQAACQCPQPIGQRPPVAAAPPTVYVLPIFMNSAPAQPSSTTSPSTVSEKKTSSPIKEKATGNESKKTSSDTSSTADEAAEASAKPEAGKSEDSKATDETKAADTKTEESKKDELKAKTETKADGKAVSEEERVGKQVGEFITKLLTKYPELMDKLKDFLEDPGPTVNRIHRAFHRSRILRLFLKIPDRMLVWPFDEETRPVMRKVLKFLKSTPKWDDFDFDFDKEFPDFAFN